jgi:peptidoglycan lytic transglycosylase
MHRVLTQVVATIAVLTTMGAAHGPVEKSSQASVQQNPPVQAAVVKPAKAVKKPYQVGPASWYGKFFHGKQTASGETYNMYEMTAAHPDLPLGTRLQVTNLHNDKTVIVRVNDRGPLVPGRIIDLSYGAAKELGFTDKGVQKVRLDIIPPDTTAVSARLR